MYAFFVIFQLFTKQAKIKAVKGSKAWFKKKNQDFWSGWKKGAVNMFDVNYACVVKIHYMQI